jgi:hypothetical protein
MSKLNVRLRISVWAAIFAGILTALITLVFSDGHSSLKLLDTTTHRNLTIADVTIFASFLIVLVTTAVYYRRLTPLSDRVSWLYRLTGRIGASILGAVFIVFVNVGIISLMQKVFPSSEMATIAAIIVLTLAGAALGFATAYFAAAVTTPPVNCWRFLASRC